MVRSKFVGFSNHTSANLLRTYPANLFKFLNKSLRFFRVSNAFKILYILDLIVKELAYYHIFIFLNLVSFLSENSNADCHPGRRGSGKSPRLKGVKKVTPVYAT